MSKLPIIKTPSTLVLQFTGRTVTLPVTSPAAVKALELLKINATQAEILAAVDPLINIRTHASGKFHVTPDGDVFVTGVRLPHILSGRLIDFADNGLLDQADALIKFWNNCLANPDKRAQTDLYAFLEHNGIPVTSDGCFIGYRSVRRLADGNLVDAHTGKFNNNVGAVCEIPRSECDSDPNRTCSRGLHVAALEYAKSFSQVLIEVKVNPKDVVAIPTDYNGQKMRVCKFEVMAINAETASQGTAITRPLYDPKADAKTDDSVVAAAPACASCCGGDKGAWKDQKRDRHGRFLPK